jgi:hypothetical protein
MDKLTRYAIESEIRRLPGVICVSWKDNSQTQVEVIVFNREPTVKRDVQLACQNYCDEPIDVLIQSTEDYPIKSGPVLQPTIKEELVLEDVNVSVDRIQVSLNYRGKSATGSALVDKREAPVGAVLEAVKNLGLVVNIALDQISIASEVTHSASVTLERPGFSEVVGVARAKDPEESAARAAVHALNRLLSSLDESEPLNV